MLLLYRSNEEDQGLLLIHVIGTESEVLPSYFYLLLLEEVIGTVRSSSELHLYIPLMEVTRIDPEVLLS